MPWGQRRLRKRAEKTMAQMRRQLLDAYHQMLENGECTCGECVPLNLDGTPRGQVDDRTGQR